MVRIVHKGEHMDKPEIILNAAQRRLGLFGYEKTTMNEIAQDLSMSKAALYYYFPDKETLFMAVIGRETDEFLALVNTRLMVIKDPEKMLYEYIKLRQDYFQKFLNLNKARFTDFKQMKPHFRESFENLKQKEKTIILKIIRSGIRAGEFYCTGLSSVALLFLDILHGLRMTVIQHKSFHEITAEDHRLMAEKHREFVSLFIRSLKIRTK